MPTNSLPKASRHLSTCILKKFSVVAFFLACPLFFFGQTLTGLWIGALSNDSNTIRKEQSFEIALTEYKGKVFGYSRSEFIVDDTLYYVVKRVKGVINGEVCEVTDDDIIAYNFRGKLDKGIKVTSIFRRNQNDSTWYLDGSWKTNATKKYYAVTGKVNLAEEKDLTASKIFPHLEELNLADDVAFYKDRQEGIPVVKVVKPEKRATNSTVSLTNDVALNPVQPNFEKAQSKPEPEEEVIAVKKNELLLPKTDTKTVESNKTGINPSAPVNMIAEAKIPEQQLIVVKKPDTDIGKTDTKNIPANQVDIKPAVASKTIAETKIPATAKNNTSPTANPENKPLKPVTTGGDEEQTLAQQLAYQRARTANTPPSSDTRTQITPPINNLPSSQQQKNNAVATTPAVAKPEKPIAEITAKTTAVAGRKSEFSQVVSFSSDSLELALYDNGEIDGDTVSIYLDGQVIMSKQGLKSSAIRKTIHIKPGQEDFTLVLFADNLGKYPPNTGLLVVRDGDDVYNLRFSSDFQKNAGIVFRRKR